MNIIPFTSLETYLPFRLEKSRTEETWIKKNQ